ncbi:MAG: acyl-CoA thioesterase, partial [Deltaproteobacteria bacterium]|nr:acyl-CoA thioesterase [Deltaproteobacteria bacterium]
MEPLAISRRIAWGDLDPAGIVFYPRYYEWIDGVAHLFFEHLGVDHHQLLTEEKLVFGLIQTSCRYSSPGFYHDWITITPAITE